MAERSRLCRCPHHAQLRKPRDGRKLGVRPQYRKLHRPGNGRSPQAVKCRGDMAAERVYNVLVLCTGNSARSILAEVLIEHWGKGRFTGYSAGSLPKGAVHPLALEELERHHLRISRLCSKSWDEFAKPGAPVMDFVFTVCDQAAGEACPVWPGNPVTAHWGVPDPAAIDGTKGEQQK